MPQLSIIIATSRPQWLANCLYQYKSQSIGSLSTELIVVTEGNSRIFDAVLHRYDAEFINKPIEGKCGAFAKDAGLAICKGDYVCFWDDDNVYYPHALATLYAASLDYDIGIVCSKHMATWFRSMPSKREILFGDIDTMCFCVRTELAKKVKWKDHDDKGTDYAYLMKLINLGATVRWVDVAIGEKLIGNMEEHC